jgi:short-subunit dehydrogenase
VDILVNNAGVAFPGFFQELNPDQVDGMINLNIRSLTRLSYLLLPGMLERGSGKILNVASVASFQPGPANSVYAASKAYVLSLTEALSEDLRGTGVTITALCPGLTKTEMIDDVADSDRIPPYLIATAESVAQEGVDALMNGEVIRIPGLANQAVANWAKYTPRWLVRSWGGMFARAQSRSQ